MLKLTRRQESVLLKNRIFHILFILYFPIRLVLMHCINENNMSPFTETYDLHVGGFVQYQIINSQQRHKQRFKRVSQVRRSVFSLYSIHLLEYMCIHIHMNWGDITYTNRGAWFRLRINLQYARKEQCTCSTLGLNLIKNYHLRIYSVILNFIVKLLRFLEEFERKT